MVLRVEMGLGPCGPQDPLGLTGLAVGQPQPGTALVRHMVLNHRPGHLSPFLTPGLGNSIGLLKCPQLASPGYVGHIRSTQDTLRSCQTASNPVSYGMSGHPPQGSPLPHHPTGVNAGLLTQTLSLSWWVLKEADL